MRIPDLESEIDKAEDYLINTCKMCGKHKSTHYQHIAESTLYCRGLIEGFRSYFVSMVEYEEHQRDIGRGFGRLG